MFIDFRILKGGSTNWTNDVHFFFFFFKCFLPCLFTLLRCFRFENVANNIIIILFVNYCCISKQICPRATASLTACQPEVSTVQLSFLRGRPPARASACATPAARPLYTVCVLPGTVRTGIQKFLVQSGSGTRPAGVSTNLARKKPISTRLANPTNIARKN